MQVRTTDAGFVTDQTMTAGMAVGDLFAHEKETPNAVRFVGRPERELEGNERERSSWGLEPAFSLGSRISVWVGAFKLLI
jgi:hypothetical protein